jgi:hypothetical protein
MILDSNWVLVIVTTVYTVATIIICWANWRSSATARQQTYEMIRQYNDSKRARIAIRFDKKSPVDRNIVLKNVGKEDANDVTLSINQEFMDELQRVWPNNVLKIGTNSTIHIAAGQEFWFFVGFSSNVDKMKATKAEVRVRYRASSKYFEEVAHIDFSQYSFMTEVSNKTVSANVHHWVSS